MKRNRDGLWKIGEKTKEGEDFRGKLERGNRKREGKRKSIGGVLRYDLKREGKLKNSQKLDLSASEQKGEKEILKRELEERTRRTIIDS